MSEPYDVSTEADRAAGDRRLCDRSGNTWVEPSPIGEPLWFDVPSLVLGLQSLMTMDKDTFEQWQSGEHAARWMNRVVRILEWVEERQRPRMERLHNEYKGKV